MIINHQQQQNEPEIYVNNNIEVDNISCFDKLKIKILEQLPHENDKLKKRWIKEFIIDCILIGLYGLILHLMITKRYILKQYRFCIPYLNNKQECNISNVKDPEFGYPYKPLSIGAPESFLISVFPFMVLSVFNIFIYFIISKIKLNMLIVWFLNILRAIATASAYTTIIVHILKYVIGIPRPNAYSVIYYSKKGEIGYSIDSAYESFPSGHIAIGYTNCWLFSILCMKSLMYSMKKFKNNLRFENLKTKLV